MGLAIIHDTVYSYGSFIRLENRSGQGAFFHVFLSAIEVQASTETNEHEQVQLPCGSERIMLVNNEPLLAEVSRTMLGRLGYQVEVHLLPDNALTAITGDPQGICSSPTGPCPGSPELSWRNRCWPSPRICPSSSAPAIHR